MDYLLIKSLIDSVLCFYNNRLYNSSFNIKIYIIKYKGFAFKLHKLRIFKMKNIMII